jgi:predicted dehydrogenase
MKFGIVGSGMIAQVHAKAVAAMAGATLHSVCNHHSGGARKLASHFGVAAYSDIQAFLADPELDIVTVCTPSGAHFEPALAALAAGKHVIVEKPLEVTTERIDLMIAAAAAAGKSLSSILNRRFTPAMDAFKQAAVDGRFGKLTSASCYVKWFRDQAYYDSAAWRGTWALDGGGVLMNQAIHAIDALIHLAGPVRSVRADAACLAHAGICAWSRDGHPVRVQLTGTEGSAFLADEAFEVWDFKHEQPADAGIRATLMNNAAAGLGANHPASIGFQQHQRNFEEIVSAIRQGREPATCANEARKAVSVIRAIYQSVRSGGEKIIP